MLSPQQKVVLDGELSLNLNIDGDMSLDIPVDGEAGTVIKVTEHDLPVYTGQTEITPSEDTQVLQTANKTLVNRVVVNPIPPNYGKIIWDGSRIRIE